MIESGFYSVPQAAERLGVSRWTAAEWVRRGCFPVRVTKINNRNRVSKVLLEEFIASGGEQVAS